MTTPSPSRILRLNVHLPRRSYPGEPRSFLVWRNWPDGTGWTWEAGIYWRDRSVPIHGRRFGKLVLRWSRNNW